MTLAGRRPAAAALALCLLAFVGVGPAAIPTSAAAQRAAAPTSAVARSPDGRIVATVGVHTTPDGRTVPAYRVSYRGAPLVDASDLGLDFADGGPFGPGARIASVTHAAHDAVAHGLLGKASAARDHYRETTVALVEDAAPHRRVDVVFRAYDDGVAFRYHVPAQPGLAEFTITEERTHVALDPQSQAYALQRSGFVSSYEGFYTVAPLREIPADTLLALPVLFHHPGGAWLAVTEADLTDYAGMYLSRVQQAPGVLASRLSPWPGTPNVKVRARAPHDSPWRVLMIADAPGRLVESNLVTLLNPPSAIGDASWVRPGKTTFPWWNDYVVPDTVPFKGGLNTATTKYYIDFCAAHGIAYHTLDGFQDTAWYGGRIDPGDEHPDVTRALPTIDLPEVLRYAKARGVRLRVWTHWKALRPQLDTALARYERMGIEGIMVDFMDRDDQDMVAFYHEVVAKAAAHHLTVVFHGAYKPTGLSRTYPNLMTVEAVMGLEYDKFDGSKGVTPSHELLVPFVRMLAGPLDFHQGGFRYVTERAFHPQYTGPRVIGTRARTLATYVVYEDYLPMMADAPSAYEGQSGLDFVAGVPTTWDETRVLNADVGHVITIARRRGTTWYVGTMTDGAARAVDVPLRFLGPGPYRADVYGDVPDAPAELQHATRLVTAADVIPAHLAPAGGHAIRLTPARAGDALSRDSRDR
ncbi:alpha-glucosidase [Gemmatimonadetes bacterium T265]|nr:alpha-glucosidase [Gemmatimonadetes bacterium T265]